MVFRAPNNWGPDNDIRAIRQDHKLASKVGDRPHPIKMSLKCAEAPYSGRVYYGHVEEEAVEAGQVDSCVIIIGPISIGYCLHESHLQG